MRRVHCDRLRAGSRTVDCFGQATCDDDKNDSSLIIDAFQVLEPRSSGSAPVIRNSHHPGRPITPTLSSSVAEIDSDRRHSLQD